MTVKIDGTNGIDTAQLRAPDGDPVAMTVGNDGKVAFPQGPVQDGPAFLATVSANQPVTSAARTRINFNTESFDTDADFDIATNRFTPQVAGYYSVTTMARVDNATTSAVLAIAKNGVDVANTGDFTTATIKYPGLNTLIFMNGTTDYVEAFATLTGTSPLVNAGAAASTQFSASLVRKA